ncbi:MAG TPA: TonB-dependent receptor, partial [Candidatus Eremiobacteraceae bacterium]|nr:TonB-dependent receptor [Candidatus Eremiobacteraceae bacterium]
DVDYTKDLTDRNNYGNYFGMSDTAGVPGSRAECGDLATDSLHECVPNDPSPVAEIRGPYNYLSTTTPIFMDYVLADTYKPSDKWTFNIGARFDQFKFDLMPLQITGINGLAMQSELQDGVCLHGYAYPVGDPCNGYLNVLATTGGGLPVDAPGQANWQNVSGALTYNDFSPRFGFTFAPSSRDVIRASVGRYVEAPNSAFLEYESPSNWGPGNTVRALNRYWDGLGFTAVHNVQPEDSTNYDLSFEHDFASGLSAKITPFYRDTRDQVLTLPVNPAIPTFVTGYNYGAARIIGSEFLLRKNRTGDEGLSATLSATYTNSKIRYTKGANGSSFIDVQNAGISAYNAAHGTNYPLLDPNGYYYPSFVQAPLVATPSYVVPFVSTLTLDERTHGFDLVPTFNFQSGAPYGDPALFPDPSGLAPVGPDPYTHTFDAPGSLKGPSYLTMNMAISHDLGGNSRASLLVTNVFTAIHNHGYPWELPASDGAISYSDNYFYQLNPLGAPALSGFPQNPAYYGDNYFPYAPFGLASARQYTFSISTKL